MSHRMLPAVRPAVKICGLTRPEDARLAVAAGAEYVGMVFGASRRRVNPEVAEEIRRAAGTCIAVGVFVDQPAPEIVRVRDRVRLEVAQLHGSESPADCEALRGSGLSVWKALRPHSREELIAQLEAFTGAVDGILVEGYSAHAAGGTGTGFTLEWWNELRALPKSVLTILAGGLGPHNVGAAVRETAPDVVDVSSGVEGKERVGHKRENLVRAFVRAARAAHEVHE